MAPVREAARQARADWREALEGACAAALSVADGPSYKAIGMLLRNRRRKPGGEDYAIRRFK